MGISAFGFDLGPRSQKGVQKNPADVGLELFDQHVRELKARAGSTDFDEGYYTKHRARFARTLELTPNAKSDGARALELGATDFFQVALKHIYGFSEVHGTVVSERVEDKLHNRNLKIENHEVSSVTYSLNLESELFPVPSGHFDLVMCCEVLEHMDIDPMFMLAEVNRVTREGGTLLLTTPNCCSARNFWKIAHGWRPHFFMQYEISRSPYRHNIEWDIHAVVQLVRSAGFEPIHAATADVFEAPLPEALKFLKSNNLCVEHRGDCIFLTAKKVSAVNSRWPEGIYI